MYKLPFYTFLHFLAWSPKSPFLLLPLNMLLPTLIRLQAQEIISFRNVERPAWWKLSKISQKHQDRCLRNLSQNSQRVSNIHQEKMNRLDLLIFYQGVLQIPIWCSGQPWDDVPQHNAPLSPVLKGWNSFCQVKEKTENKRRLITLSASCPVEQIWRRENMFLPQRSLQMVTFLAMLFFACFATCKDADK